MLYNGRSQLGTRVLSAVKKILAREPAVELVDRDFWNDMCARFGIVVALPHITQIEVLRRTSSHSEVFEHWEITPETLAKEWSEFVANAAASGTSYSIRFDLLGSDEPLTEGDEDRK